MEKSLFGLTERVKAVATNAAEAAASKVVDVTVYTAEVGKKISDMGSNAAEATVGQISQTATIIGKTTGETVSEAGAIVQSTYVFAVDSASRAGSAATEVAGSMGSAIAAGAETFRRGVATVATTALDQNGDGIFDQEDIKLLTQSSLAATKAVATEMGGLAKEVVSSELVKDAASAAAVGAAIAIPVPLIGPTAGAVIGGVIGVYTNLRKK